MVYALREPEKNCSQLAGARTNLILARALQVLNVKLKHQTRPSYCMFLVTNQDLFPQIVAHFHVVSPAVHTTVCAI